MPNEQERIVGVPGVPAGVCGACYWHLDDHSAGWGCPPRRYYVSQSAADWPDLTTWPDAFPRDPPVPGQGPPAPVENLGVPLDESDDGGDGDRAQP